MENNPFLEKASQRRGSLLKEGVRKLSKIRLSRARIAWKEGLALFEHGFFMGAVNRFYYAAFYAARDLLATKELDSSKHSGVIALFHKHFLRTHLFEVLRVAVSFFNSTVA